MFGVLLYWVDQNSVQNKVEQNWNTIDAIKLGIWQAIALIPGSSRSGMTITGARRLGYTRIDSARISMLMSIPTIIASGTFLGTEVIIDANWHAAKIGMIAAIFSFFAGIFALNLMMRLLKSVSYTPYVIYRIFFGLFLLWIAYS